MLRLCSISDLLEGHSKGFALGERLLLAIKKCDSIYIYQNSCPHLNIPLEWQANQFLDADAELIQCSTHGALFLIETGQCISGPCNGQHLTKVEYTIKNDEVWIA